MGLADSIESALGVSQPPARTYTAKDFNSYPAGTTLEQADQEDARSPASRAELEKELSRPNIHPVARKALQEEYDSNFGKHVGLGDSIAEALNTPVTGAPPPRDMNKWVPDSAEPVAPPKEQSLEDRAKSIAMTPIHGSEAALTAVTGAVAAPIARAAGVVKALTSGELGTQENAWKAAQWASDIERSLTYSPRLQGSKDILDAAGKVVDATKIAGLGPPEAGMLAQTKLGQVPRPEFKGAEVPTGARASVGAAGTNPEVMARSSVANASPELRAVVDKSLKNGRISQEILDRHVEADSLPIPIRLTEGQATRDPVVLSQEQNMRGRHNAYAQRFSEQNKQLIENANAIRESSAPDIYVQSKPELGDVVIQGYRDKDAALNTNISKAYKALEDANGGSFPLDAKAFATKADAELHKKLLYDHVPGELKKTIERLSENGMTFENFESLRTNLARIQRSATADGNAKAAAGVIRDALEEMPMPAGAEHLKPLADNARALAKERFDIIKKDPAYKAVVEGKASADRFMDKYVIGADVKNIETMLKNVPEASQASRAGIMNHLRRQAGILDENNGNFSQAGYNKALEGLRPKLGVVFDPEHAQQIENLGKVARYTQEQPRGSFVNNSNTFVGAIAEGAKSAAESTVNAIFRFPVGTAVRDASGRISEGKIVNRSLQTGAGIKLKDVGKR